MRKPAEVIKLTQAVIEALPPAAPGARDAYRFGGALKGLELRVYPTGAKTFSYAARGPDGDTQRAPVGKFPEELRTAEQIKEKLKTVREQVARGENLAEEKRKRRAELTVTKAFENRHDARVADGKEKQAAGEITYFERHIRGAIGRLRLSEVTRDTVRGVHAAISRKKSEREDRSGRLTVTANRVVSLLSSVFKFAGFEKEDNPARGITRNKETKRKRFIQEKELPLFFEALELVPNADMSDFFRLCLFTGARRGNVMAMNWGNVEIAEQKWLIPVTKSGEPQWVTLAPEAVGILEARREAVRGSIQQYVFPGPGNRGHIVEPKKSWSKVCDGMRSIEMLHAMFPDESGRGEREQWKAKLRDNFTKAEGEILKAVAASGRKPEHFNGGTDLHIHDLRHTLASWQAGQNVSLSIIGESLGHKDGRTTERYAHVPMGAVRAAVNNAVSAIAAAGAAPFKSKVVGLKRAAPKAAAK